MLLYPCAIIAENDDKDVNEIQWNRLDEKTNYINVVVVIIVIVIIFNLFTGTITGTNKNYPSHTNRSLRYHKRMCWVGKDNLYVTNCGKVGT